MYTLHSFPLFAAKDIICLLYTSLYEEIEGKRIIIIDDSIVRGTTSYKIIQMLKNAGAKEVHMRISSPPVLNPCYFGIDISSKEHLIAANYSIEEIRESINADTRCV